MTAIVVSVGLLTGCEAETGVVPTPAPVTKSGSSMHPSKIAFTDNGGPSGPSVYVMNSDGTELRALLEDAITPAFTSDGSGIVFASGRRGHNRTETYLMDADGGNIRPLTGEGTALPSPDPYYSTTLPAFSPDGTHLLVTRWTQNSAKVMTGAEIWVMNPDGSDPRRLTEPNQPARAASWGGNPDS